MKMETWWPSAVRSLSSETDPEGDSQVSSGDGTLLLKENSDLIPVR